MQWYQDAELQGQWELEVSQSGVYRFVSDEGLVIVERLREAEMIYALQHYETVPESEERSAAPIPRAMRGMGAVSLQPQAQNLRAPRSSRGRRTVVTAEVPVAWSAVAVESGATEDPASSVESADNEAEVADVAVGADPDPRGDISVSITPGQWSATHTDTDQVMVLQVR